MPQQPDDFERYERLIQRIGQHVKRNPPPKYPSKQAEQEDFFLAYGLPLLDLLYQKIQQDMEHSGLKSEELEQILDMRRPYAKAFSWFAGAWLLITVAVIVCTGAGILNLSDSVLHWMIGGVAVDLVGLLFVIAQFLFKTPIQK